jgi:hypothetical protein
VARCTTASLFGCPTTYLDGAFSKELVLQQAIQRPVGATEMDVVGVVEVGNDLVEEIIRKTVETGLAIAGGHHDHEARWSSIRGRGGGEGTRETASIGRCMQEQEQEQEKEEVETRSSQPLALEVTKRPPRRSHIPCAAQKTVKAGPGSCFGRHERRG